MTTPRALPMATAPPRVRRDAAANSDRILAAARTVIERDGIDALTMDRLASCAGVGKGTIFRAFGNRSGLFAALTDEAERRFQQEFLAGPPPLGPDAPPLQRLLAYGAARLRLFAIHGPLLMAVESDAPDQFDVPARQLSANHVRMLLRQCGVRDNVEVMSESLLAPLDAGVTHHLLVTRKLGADELIAGWQEMARSLVGGEPSSDGTGDRRRPDDGDM